MDPRWRRELRGCVQRCIEEAKRQEASQLPSAGDAVIHEPFPVFFPGFSCLFRQGVRIVELPRLCRQPAKLLQFAAVDAKVPVAR